MADLVAADISLLSILQRLGLKLGFGEATVGEVCSRCGISVDLFIIICNIYSFSDYEPNVASLGREDAVNITAYLRASHRYYAERMLPHTARHLEEVLSHCDDLSERVLRRFYEDYTRYIKCHFEEEEREIFTLMERGGERDANFALFDMPHTDIDDRSNDIASLIVKSLPESAPTSLRCDMLKDVYELRDDLRRHSNIETYVLRPLVENYLNRR